MVEFDAIPTSTEQIASAIVDSAVTVHKALGPGLLESVYEICLGYELLKRGIPFRRQLDLPVLYDGVQLPTGFRIDMMVNECVVIELKSVEAILPVHEAQLLTYLKLTDKRLGFLLNFNVPLMKNGIKRIVL